MRGCDYCDATHQSCRCGRGRLSTRLHNIEVEDYAEALLTFGNGATGYILYSTNEPIQGNYLEVVGDRGRLVLGENRLEVSLLQRGLRDYAAHSPEMWGRPEMKPLPLTITPQKPGHATVMRNFARHILRGEALRCERPREPGVEMVFSRNSTAKSFGLRQVVSP